MNWQDEGPKTPLSFVARFTLNHNGNGFVEHHKIRKNGDKYDRTYANFTDKDVGYFCYDNSATLMQQSINDTVYEIPTLEQWYSISPENNIPGNMEYPVEYNNHQGNIQRQTEKAQIGPAPANVQEYESEYTYVVPENTPESNLSPTVTYAIRFKGTEWQSAWRYEWVGDEGAKPGVEGLPENEIQGALVKCVSLAIGETLLVAGEPIEREEITLAHIQSDRFFQENPATIRFFPAYGSYYYNEYTGEEELTPGDGKYFTATYGNPENYYTAHLGPSSMYYVFYNNRERTYTPIRPFIKAVQ